MIELGKKSEIFGADQLQRITISGRPTLMPSASWQQDHATGRTVPQLPSENHRVICGLKRGLHVYLFVCQSVEDMQRLWDAHDAGNASTIDWYTGEDPGLVIPLT